MMALVAYTYHAYTIRVQIEWQSHSIIIIVICSIWHSGFEEM